MCAKNALQTFLSNLLTSFCWKFHADMSNGSKVSLLMENTQTGDTDTTENITTVAA